MLRKLSLIYLVAVLAVIFVNLTPCPSLAAMGSYTSGTTSSVNGECKAVLFRFDNRGGFQYEELIQNKNNIYYWEWESELKGGNTVNIHYRNGATQTIQLVYPASRLHLMGYYCGSDGLAKLRIYDCQTQKPLGGVVIRGQGKQFGAWTKADGKALVPCACKPPKKYETVLTRKGYQTKKVIINFSGKKIDRYQVCLRKVGTVAPPPQAKPGVKWRGHRYLVMLKSMDWNQARAYAKRVGGYLATISDKAESDFVSKLARDKGVKRASWIGYSDQGSEGRWWWVTGQKTTFTNWYRNEPNNVRNEEHCCMMGWHNKDTWNDGSCGEKLPFVIEWNK